MDMNPLVEFNPEISAEFIKDKLIVRQSISLEIVEELYKARSFYSNRGFRSDLDPHGSRLSTFENYYNFIGLPKTTGNRWLDRYIPEENKLLTTEELKEKKQINHNIEKQIILNEVEDFHKKGIKSKDWGKSHEKVYSKILQKNDPKTHTSREDFDYRDHITSPEDMQKLKDDVDISREYLEQLKLVFQEQEADEALKQKLKLSGRYENLSQEVMFELIDDYLQGIPDISRRLESTQNMIKYLRDKSVKMQLK
jgi:hypothetical protein